MTGLGTLPARVLERAYESSRLLRLPLLAMSGWGLVALLSAIGAVIGIDQSWLARALLILGLLLLVPWGGARTAQRHLLGDLIVLLLLVAPMGVLVAGTPAAAYDEFAQWLPNTRYLVEHAHYWVWPDWLGQTSKPGYPNASLTVALLVSQLIGPEIEAPFKTFVVILLGGYGAVLADLAETRFLAPERRWARWLAPIALLALGCLIAFLDPFVDPRISFTSYTDTPSAILIAVASLTACHGVAAARRGAFGVAAGWFGWTGLLSLTLILLRTTNLVLVAALAGAIGVFLLIGKTGSRLWIRWALLLIVPAAIGDLVWSAHLSLARIGPDISPKSMAFWDWKAPIIVSRAFFLDRLTNNPLLGGVALGVAVLAVIGGLAVWRRLHPAHDDNPPPPRLMVSLAAIVCACFVAFLAWAYIAVFSSEEVAAAASLWRYLSELGPLVVLAICCAALALVPKRRWNRPLAVTVAVTVFGTSTLLLPLLLRPYYSLDCRFPDIAAARQAIAELRPALEPFATSALNPARVAVVNPNVGDWMAFALAFDMRWPASDRVVQSRVKAEPLAETEDWAWNRGLAALLDFTPLDRAALRTRPVVPTVSLLGRPAAKGDAWPVLATTSPHPRPPCSLWSR